MNAGLRSFLVPALLGLIFAGISSNALADRRNNNRDTRYQNEQVCHYCGEVRSISRISSHRQNTGAVVLGALVGGALGNQVGKGDGRKAATVAGAVAGGAIANNSTKDRNGRVVYRISVRMDTGRVYNFDQSDTRGLRPGTRVEVQDGYVYRAR